MASYWIDGERWTPEGSFNEWQELLTAIYKELTPRKRGLQKILADGEELTSLMAGQTPAQTPDSYGRIDFKTLEVIQIAFQGLENGRTFIPNLQKILLGAAEFARLGDDQKKGEAISGTVYSFQWLSSPGTLLLITGLLVAVIIVTGILSGVFTATESASVAVLYALVITVVGVPDAGMAGMNVLLVGW